MVTLFILLTLAVLVSFVGTGAEADCGFHVPSNIQMPPGTESETVSFDSYKSLSYPDAVTDRTIRSEPLKVSSLVLKPAGGGPFPTVIVSHGSSGMHDEHYAYAQKLLKQGFAVAMFDGFCERGMKSVTGKLLSISLPTTVADYYRLLDALGKKSYVDKRNVGLMGTSRGGSAALLAADDQMRKRFSRSGLGFKSITAVYPGCVNQFAHKTPSSATVLVQLAANDEHFPPQQCRDVVGQMKKSGFDISSTEYAAGHGWDIGTVKRAEIPNEFNYGNCNIVIGEDGIGKEQTSGIRITSEETVTQAYGSCRKKGAYVGADKAVAEKSYRELSGFLERTLEVAPSKAAGRATSTFR
jgi:dienelactone hydrolase